MGSVKDLKIINYPTSSSLGSGYFTFSDRYSVFDWGQMPDNIPLKGASLALMGAKSFELLSSVGAKTHYVGLIESGCVKHLSELRAPSAVMGVNLTNVIKPVYDASSKSYDYSFFKANNSVLDNYLIPLECIYRNGLPVGSSVFDKLKSGKLSLGDLGFKSMPSPGDMLPKSLYDFSTKLEESGDRMIKDKFELLTVSGLNESQFADLESKLCLANDVITSHCGSVGLINWDGKFEFMKYDGDIVFVDVLGTPDECRFSLGALQVSKEVIRQWYKKNQPEWSGAVNDYKKKFSLDWRDQMIADGLTPVALPSSFLGLVSEMYASTANLYCDRKFFDVRSLPEVMKDLDDTGCAIKVA